MPKSSKVRPSFLKSEKNKKKSNRFIAVIKRAYEWVKNRIDGFLARRPHRSFRRTRRRDYVRPLVLPGNVAFTNEVFRTIWRLRKQLALLFVLYVVFYIAAIGITSQESYATLSASLQEAGEEVVGGDWGGLSQASVVFFSVATSGLTDSLSEGQQLFGILLTTFMWLTIVWLLRNSMAGHTTKLRDALYNSGAPVFATLVVMLVIVLQLIPVGLAALGYISASSTGLLNGGVETMLFWLAAGLLGVLSLFWITSSSFALIIVTLPGMYPFKALKSSGDIVLGRRVTLLLRWLWMFVVVAFYWTIILIPVILLDMWLKSTWTQLEWMPTIPVVLLVLGALTIIWVCTYIYLLYRKVVQNGTE